MSDDAGGRLDEAARIPSLDDGKQYKFLGVLESVMQEDKLVLGCAAKEYLLQIIDIRDVYYLDKSPVGPQSCDRVKPVCLAGAGVTLCGRNSGR